MPTTDSDLQTFVPHDSLHLDSPAAPPKFAGSIPSLPTAIRQGREHSGFTLEALAAATGISADRLSAFERGDDQPGATENALLITIFTTRASEPNGELPSDKAPKHSARRLSEIVLELFGEAEGEVLYTNFIRAALKSSMRGDSRKLRHGNTAWAFSPETPIAELPQFLTVAEVAYYLGVSKPVVYAAVAGGDLPGIRPVGRHIRIPREALAKENLSRLQNPLSGKKEGGRART